MKKWNIEEYCGKEYVVFNAIDPETGRNAGCAEFSISEIPLSFKGKSTKNLQWFFNRLYVKPEFRNCGAATVFLERVKKYVFEKDICLYCGINPYGDLNYRQLNDLYKKHGFQRKLATYDTFNMRFYGLFMNLKF